MNHVYRVIWNVQSATWQAVSETAIGKSKSRKSAKTTRVLKQLAQVCSVAAGIVFSGVAMAAPSGGVIASGNASIGTSGSTTTINQNTSKAIINWNDFSIGSDETVRFVQPSSNAIALNRVVSASPSSIQGMLKANGQVFLLNPNGISFGNSAQVNVGGLVASTLDISNSNFINGNYRFAGNGNSSVVNNQGNISVANKGSLAFIAPVIQQAGTIVVTDGTVLLTAAADVTLKLTNRVLNSQTINAGQNTATINNSAGTLQADGGKVILTAQGTGASGNASIHSAGIIQARTLAGGNRGSIELASDMHSGSVNVSGTLDTSASVQGAGGTLNTSAAVVKIEDAALINTVGYSTGNAAPVSGEWKLTANNIDVASGATLSGSQLGATLDRSNVTLIAKAVTGQLSGNINIGESVYSNNSVVLGLHAAGDIIFNQGLTLTGDSSKLQMKFGVGHDYQLQQSSSITLSGTHAGLQLNGTDFTLINSLGVAGDTSAATLQGMKNNLSGNYALGINIDASETVNWNNGAGFTPIGSYGSYNISYAGSPTGNGGFSVNGTVNNPFKGQFHGLGNFISGLFIDTTKIPDLKLPGILPLTYSFSGSTGLFAASTNTLRDIVLNSSTVLGTNKVGLLTGAQLQGSISNSLVGGNVSGTTFVGGLTGVMAGQTIISNSHSTVDLSGLDSIGGLAGAMADTSLIRDSNASGSISGEQAVGGLAGVLSGSATISSSHSANNVEGLTKVGGLAGEMLGNSRIDNTYSSATVHANEYAGGIGGAMQGNALINQSFSTQGGVFATNNSGGLVGSMSDYASIRQSYSNLDVNGINNIGGLVGMLGDHGSIKDSYSNSAVFGVNSIGGLAGILSGSAIISSSHSANNVEGSTKVGGLVGEMLGSSHIEQSYSSGHLNEQASYNSSLVGGLVGLMHGQARIDNSYSSATIYANEYAGGIAGAMQENALINQSFFSTAGSLSIANNAGGLVGSMSDYASIRQSYNNLDVNGISNIGGLVGKLAGHASIEDSYSNASVFGLNYVGGLVGQIADAASIRNSHATGDVTGMTDFATSRAVGGLLGGTDMDPVQLEFNIIIDNSYSSGSVTGGEAVGGFIGSLAGGAEISNSRAYGNVGGANTITAGGFAGHLQEVVVRNSFSTGNVNGLVNLGGFAGSIRDTTVQQSYSTGNVKGFLDIGGLVGFASGNSDIVNTYSTGASIGFESVGGLLGSMSSDQANVNIVNSYASGAVEGITVHGIDYINHTGGLVGYVNESSTVTNSYWNTTTSGQASSAGGTGKTTAQLKQIATFSGWDIADLSNTTSNSIWVIDENNSTPRLR